MKCCLPIRTEFDWDYQTLIDRLVWCYGADRAAEIIAGRDPQANADLEAWRQLGKPKLPQPGGAP